MRWSEDVRVGRGGVEERERERRERRGGWSGAGAVCLRRICELCRDGEVKERAEEDGRGRNNNARARRQTKVSNRVARTTDGTIFPRGVQVGPKLLACIGMMVQHAFHTQQFPTRCVGMGIGDEPLLHAACCRRAARAAICQVSNACCVS